jgi:AcrR family transcriptional regulator
MAEAIMRRNRVYAVRMPPEERREQLLDGVLRVIADQGVHKVSMDSVAREVGVTRPVVYGLFADSNDLLRASLDREEKAALAQMAGVLSRAEASETADRIPALLRGFVDAAIEAPDRWRAILMVADSSTPAFRKRLDRGRRALTDAVEALLHSTFRYPDVDIGMAAHALQGYMYDSARLALADPDRFPPDRVVAFGATLFGALAPR